MLRIISSNLNGIRSAQRKGFYIWLAKQQASHICLQELKAQEQDLTDEMRAPGNYHGIFHAAEKKGYSGVGLYLQQKPQDIIKGIGISEFDCEGRYIEARYKKISIVSLYLPSGSSSEERQQVKFRFMDAFFEQMKALRASGREVIISGDWNIAHREQDLKNWRSNQKNSGFLPEERAWLTRLFDELGWVDVYRQLHPDTTNECYTWWSNRGQAWANNVGWRLDYQIATPGVAATAQAASVYKAERFSDHSPLTIDYDFTI